MLAAVKEARDRARLFRRLSIETREWSEDHANVFVNYTFVFTVVMMNVYEILFSCVPRDYNSILMVCISLIEVFMYNSEIVNTDMLFHPGVYGSSGLPTPITDSAGETSG